MAEGEYGVACGLCGGGVYMETCETNNGIEGHYSVLASECHTCGFRYEYEQPCPDCSAQKEENER